ncbi:hypothetical protein BKE38_01530 [Pseudoroseomonas deserti]|uniref:Uncharacterized protein n=1 Tax=Teichococcus deserti TaxID=1817963 RepID=A0A1V2HA25_9PROT|nr:DUF4286 family protein [Pseudoroseomonas deserti]ONG58910.1 hypothetical protein BKE38_01530 [Pseudoroseomonas deserti]
MADLLISAAGPGPRFAAVDDLADVIAWQEPAGPGSGDRYRLMQAIGAAGVEAPFLYIVEQDVAATDEKELNRWYFEEHLPRLGAVPGVISARRYALVEGSARKYLAAYRLERQGVFEGPDWLVARQTPWTATARLLFKNPSRKMRKII